MVIKILLYSLETLKIDGNADIELDLDFLICDDV